MHRTVPCLAALTIELGAFAADGGLQLAREGTSEYRIVLPDTPTPVEQTAACELREHLSRVTGADLAICAEAQVPPGVPRILVGATAAIGELLPGFDAATAAPDAIRVKTMGRDLVLTGHPRRGVLYAVYTFLEDVVGVRWWSASETEIPRLPTLVIPALDVDYAPRVSDRATRYLQLSDGCFTSHSTVTKREQHEMGVFSARLRLNGHDHYSIPSAYGGANGLIGWVHTFYQINGLLPPDRYFREHPDWYSLVSGTRRDQKGQLCLTNEQMRREMVRVVLDRLRRHPDATMISVSQNDWRGNCECDQCRAIDEREGTPAGSLIHFVNAVAERVEKEFPDVLVETLAYHYTRKPPKHIRPRRNVVVRLCTIECSFAEPLETGESNRAFREDIEEWSRIAPQLYIWDYATNFSSYLVPHPNLHVLGANIRYFVGHKAMGIFEQGDSGCRVGDFVRLRAWLLAHLLWNPDADQEELVREFLSGYYGAAAPSLSAYLDCLREAVERSGVHLGCFRSDTSDWLTLEVMNRGMQLFAQALEAVADDPVLHQRVRRERLPLDHVWLRRYRPLLSLARRTGTAFLGPAEPQAALDEFLALTGVHRVGRIRQGQAFPDDFAERLPPFILPPAELPEDCRGLPESDWIDLQDTDYIPRRRPDLFAIVDDPAASNARARRMPNTHTIWACHSYALGSFGIDGTATWRVRIWVRADAASDQGPAMSVGIYDEAARRSVISRCLTAQEVRGDTYQVIDLGSHRLTPAVYVWAAPVVREPNEVDAVYVDRVLLVREP